MKKLTIFFCFFLSVLSVSAQLDATGNYAVYQNFAGVDYLFVFNGILPETKIRYTGSGDNVKWYKFSDLTAPCSTFPYIYPEDVTGYVLDVDGQQTTVWVIDYQNYLPVFHALTPDESADNQCNELTLLLDADVPELYYYTLTGIRRKIDRNFTLSYQTLEWDNEWKTVEKTKTIILPITDITVPAPLCNTQFSLKGDQFASEPSLGIQPIEIISSMYAAVSLECHIKYTTTERIEKNEDERPTSDALSGSAPLEIFFNAEVNNAGTIFYKWDIYKDNQLMVSRSDKEHRYTFSEAGTYNVKLTVNNEYCSASDSVSVSVSASDLQVPNVFTPNGDGINDEFRVAYKSLVSFDARVYNRWGRMVYHWSNPQKGWDGTIGGKKAPTGAYYYVIKAVGADGIKYSKKGDINLLRGKEN